MSDTSSMLLIGIGGAGCSMARGVCRAYGDAMRCITVDTDATTPAAVEDSFILIGGDRLAGRGAGGDVVAARFAAEESMQLLDDEIEGARLAIVVAALGGGTGGGVALETVKHLSKCGIPSVVFATLPFQFEGDNRRRNAENVATLIEEEANATFFIPLDDLVAGEDVADMAMRRAIDTVATGVTLFWRLVEKPGYIRLDAERIRHLLGKAGRGRFATVIAQGDDRAEEAVGELVRSRLLTTGNRPVRAILLGVLAGEDLRLSEISRIASGVRTAFGEKCAFELATVNDEMTFTGRLCVVAMLFESDATDTGAAKPGTTSVGRRKHHTALGNGPHGRGKFNNAEHTVWNGEDLDVPTYMRRNISLDF